MIHANQKTKVVFSTKEGFLDPNLYPTQPSKTDIIISCVQSNSLIKAQIHLEKDFLHTSNITLSDLIYAKCVEKGFFEPNIKYAFVYFCKDLASEQIFEIYGIDLDSILPNEILIPDIFLPMALDAHITASNLFLFGKNLVFYHQNKLAYHILCQDVAAIVNALDYIRAIYSINPSVIYVQDQEISDIPFLTSELKTLINNSQNPIATLSFAYFSKSQSSPLPLLFAKPVFSFWKSKFFRLLFKTACVTFLMLLYPLGTFIHHLYLKNQFQELANKNFETIKKIATLTQNLEYPIKQPAFQKDINTIYKIQSSYLPRYNLIANVSKTLQDKEVMIEDFYLGGDIFQNAFALSLEITSLSQKDIIHSVNALKKSLFQPSQQEKIFSSPIMQAKEKSSAQIIWVHNVL